MAKRLIDATISLYDSCRGQLLPTPAKSHYVFNLRDVGRIVQGMMLVAARTVGTERWSMIRLWTHECVRYPQDTAADMTGLH